MTSENQMMDKTKQSTTEKVRAMGDDGEGSNASPLVMYDGNIMTDGGHFLFVQYVDINSERKGKRASILVKGIESEYSLAHSDTVRISTPHRFQKLGETLIRDDQEGRAQNRNEERQSNDYEKEREEQENALHHLGMTNISLGSQTDWNSKNATDAYTFGGGSWIFCSAIQPTTEDEWQDLRDKLPPSYNDFTTIHQPTKFAQALGLMFMDQIGPQNRNGKLTHGSKDTNPLVTLHDCQHLFHGPVLYTDDVFGFLSAHQKTSLAQIYPLFVKDQEHEKQREYRFVLVGNQDVEDRHIDLRVSGMMRDSLLPVRSRSEIRLEADPDGPRTEEPRVVAPKKYAQTENQSKRKVETRTMTLTVDGEVTRLLHKSWHVVVTQAPAFSVARAWRSSPSSLSLLFIDRIALPAGRMMRPAR